MKSTKYPPHRVEMGKKISMARKQKFPNQELAAEKLSVERSTVSKWETGANEIHSSHFRTLKEVLGLTDEDINEYLKARDQANGNYPGGTFSYWMDRGYTLKELLDLSYELMDLWPEDYENDYGPNGKWNELAALHPTGCFLVFDHDLTEALGYWQVLSISEEYYARGLAGENINRDLTPAQTYPLILPNCTHLLYFVDCFVHGEKQNSGVSKAIHKGVSEFLRELLINEQYVERILAHASSYWGIGLCSKAGFEDCGPHLEHRMAEAGTKQPIPTRMYELNMAGLLDNTFFKGDAMVKKKYVENFGSLDH